MTKNLQAIYDNGVLRLLEPLQLPDQKLVTVAIIDDAQAEPWLDSELNGELAGDGDESVTLEEVRAALKKIPGSLTGDFVAERDER
jgi:predicted DNA-binding antitoxin AbrB/MazE fold protein